MKSSQSSLPGCRSLYGGALGAACALLFLGAVAHAASPTISFGVDSFYVGSTVTLSASVADADADMDYVTFSVSGPGTSGWAALSPNVTVPGAGTAAQQSGVVVQKNWAPSLPGLWTVRVTAHSLNGSSSVDRTLDVLAGTRTVGTLTVTSGASQMISYPGEIVTLENTSGTSVVAQNGSTLILWAGGRVKLKPGFRASEGSFFWAAVDHDMDGYSDIEEITDTDGDGMPDAWEVDHGLNPIANDAGGDLDSDGTTNLAEYLAGRNPNNKADGATLGSYNLVLRTPSGAYYGLNASTWVITPVAAP